MTRHLTRSFLLSVLSLSFNDNGTSVEAQMISTRLSRLRMSKDGLEHELWQFSIESMLEIIEKINKTRQGFSEYQEACDDRMAIWHNEKLESREKNANE